MSRTLGSQTLGSSFPPVARKGKFLPAAKAEQRTAIAKCLGFSKDTFRVSSNLVGLALMFNRIILRIVPGI